MSELEISVETLAEELGAEGARPLLLDVRNPDEFAWVALPGALLIPLDELPDRVDELEPHRARRIVCYCHHGVRSLGATALLAERGFRTVSLAGGIDAWSRRIDPALPRY